MTVLKIWSYVVGVTLSGLVALYVTYIIFDWWQRRKAEKNFQDYTKRTYPNNTKEPGKWPTDRT